MKIVAFAGSTSSKSINKQLVGYTSQQFVNQEIELHDLNDFEAPIYSMDREEESGIPEPILELAAKLDNADLILLSLAEHNGSFTAAFKNTYDWLSRIKDRKVFGEKPIFLMAASPGGRGGAGVLEAATSRIPRDGSDIVATFSFPRFYDNFKNGEIVNNDLKKELLELIDSVQSSLQ